MAPPPGPPVYPGAPYPQYAFAAAGPQPQNTAGTLGLVFGIIGIVLAICCAALGLVSSVAGLVCGVVGVRKASAGLATNRGVALAGAICGGIGTVLAVANMVLGFWLGMNGYMFT